MQWSAWHYRHSSLWMYYEWQCSKTSSACRCTCNWLWGVSVTTQWYRGDSSAQLLLKWVWVPKAFDSTTVALLVTVGASTTTFNYSSVCPEGSPLPSVRGWYIFKIQSQDVLIMKEWSHTVLYTTLDSRARTKRLYEYLSRTHTQTQLE